MKIWLKMKLVFGVVQFVMWQIDRKQGSETMWRLILNLLNNVHIAPKCPSREIHWENTCDHHMEPNTDWQHFAGICSLESYMTKVENDSGTSVCFSCNYCGKIMARKDHMKNHIQTHFSQQEAWCNICGFMCKNIPALKVHIFRKHSREMHGSNTWVGLLQFQLLQA